MKEVQEVTYPQVPVEFLPLGFSQSALPILLSQFVQAIDRPWTKTQGENSTGTLRGEIRLIGSDHFVQDVRFGHHDAYSSKTGNGKPHSPWDRLTRQVHKPALQSAFRLDLVRTIRPRGQLTVQAPLKDAEVRRIDIIVVVEIGQRAA